jgi:hypothetical protein
MPEQRIARKILCESGSVTVCGQKFHYCRANDQKTSTWRHFEFVRKQARYGATQHKVGRMKIAAMLKPVQRVI